MFCALISLSIKETKKTEEGCRETINARKIYIHIQNIIFLILLSFEKVYAQSVQSR